MKSARSFVLAVSVLLAFLSVQLRSVPPVSAQESQAEVLGLASERAEYEACLKLARRDGPAAYESALAWFDAGGGNAALHCAAYALLQLGHFAEAAQRFEQIAQISEDSFRRAGLFAQASQAWLEGGELSQAMLAQNEALALLPNDPDLYIDRARIFVEAGLYWEAIDDLNRAHDLNAQRADILVYRASAYRFLGIPELAIDDAERALQLDPGSAEAYLERGILRRLAGNEEGAREDWLDVLRLAPGSPAAQSAQINIERMDLNID